MPNKASGKKALRQTKKHQAANIIVKEAYKKAMKEVLAAVEAGKDAKELVRLAQKKLGKAAKKGVIEKRTASRKLSRLMKKVNVKGKK